MVGHIPLEDGIGVRVPVPQQTQNHPFRVFLFARETKRPTLQPLAFLFIGASRGGYSTTNDSEYRRISSVYECARLTIV